jgi:hypothetical protein
MKGGRRNAIERQRPKCEGQQDPVSLELIEDPQFAIRLLENGHYFCYDIRTLFNWFQTGSRINPANNVRFSDANIAKIFTKFGKVGLPVAPVHQPVGQFPLPIAPVINVFQAAPNQANGQDILENTDRALIHFYRHTCLINLSLNPGPNQMNTWYIRGNPLFDFDLGADPYLLFFTPERQGRAPEYFIIVARTVDILRRIRAQLNQMNLAAREEEHIPDRQYEYNL